MSVMLVADEEGVKIQQIHIAVRDARPGLHQISLAETQRKRVASGDPQKLRKPRLSFPQRHYEYEAWPFFACLVDHLRKYWKRRESVRFEVGPVQRESVVRPCLAVGDGRNVNRKTTTEFVANRPIMER